MECLNQKQLTRIRALAEDKHLTKILSQNIGIPTAKWKLYRKDDKVVDYPEFPPPYFVKWRFGASSRDVDINSISHTKEQMINKIIQLQSEGKDVIVEELLEGQSITTPVLFGEKPIILPSIITESNKPYGIVTYKQGRKLEGGMNRFVLTDTKLEMIIQNFCLLLYDAVRPIDYFRADFKINTNTGIPNLLEFNVCCNLSSGGAICQSCNAIGITQKELLSHIIHQSLIRQTF